MILPDATTAVYLDDLVANPDNPRQSIGDVTELAESIREVGLLTPLLVVDQWGPDHTIGIAGSTGRYMVVDGHRRLAALQHLDFDDTIPVRVVEMNRTERLLAALATQGKPLDPIDEARAYRALMDLDLTQRQIAERVGCNQSHVSRRLALLDLDEHTTAALAEGKVKLRDAEAKARGKEPSTPKVKPGPPLVDTEALLAENNRLREIAAKAREGLAAVRSGIEEQGSENEALQLEVTELRAAIAELEADNDRPMAVLDEIAPLGYAILWREPGEQEWSTTESVIFDVAEVDAREAACLQPNDEWIVVALHPIRGLLPAAVVDDDAEPETTLEDLFAPDPPASIEDADAEMWASETAAPANPEWATKQPWGTYRMSAAPRLLGVIAKCTQPATLRHVIAFETANDGRPVVLDAARARLVEVGGEVAA